MVTFEKGKALGLLDALSKKLNETLDNDVKGAFGKRMGGALERIAGGKVAAPLSIKRDDGRRASIGIRLEGEREKLENEKCAEIAERTISDAEASGCFKPEFMPALSEKILAISRPGFACSDPFDRSDCMSLEEKKELGLNARRKYSRELISGLTRKGLAAENPNDLLKNMFYQNVGKVSRKYDLKQLKGMGIKRVKISDSGDERDCAAIKRLEKVWPIDEVPELPLPQCDAAYCRCNYIAVFEDILRELEGG